MPPGRRSRIHEIVVVTDPETGEQQERTLTESICRYLALGCYLNTTAEAHGISIRSLENWLARGREHDPQLSDDPPEDVDDLDTVPEGERIYVQFLRATTRARARGVNWHETNLRRGAVEDPRLSLEYLQRIVPERYAKRVQVSADVSGQITISDERAREIDERIEELMAGVGRSRPAPPPV